MQMQARQRGIIVRGAGYDYRQNATIDSPRLYPWGIKVVASNHARFVNSTSGARHLAVVAFGASRGCRKPWRQTTSSMNRRILPEAYIEIGLIISDS
jgi:hypothetical protein